MRMLNQRQKGPQTNRVATQIGLGALGATGLVALGSTQAWADPGDAIVQAASKGLQEYQIFKNVGTNLTGSKDVAQYIHGSGIGVTVVTPEQLGGASPSDVAKAIQGKTAHLYDTVLVVVDGDTDSFGSYSTSAQVQTLLNSTFTGPVADAGVFLNGKKGEFLAGYSGSGGKVPAGTDAANNLVLYKKAQDEAAAKAKQEAAAKAQNDPGKLIENTVSGLKQYQVYKMPGTNLTDGTTLAQKVSNTKIGITIVTPEQLGSRDPAVAAQTIHQTMGDARDVVILVVDGPESDTISVASNLPTVAEQMQAVWGTKPVPDAGWTLLSTSDQWLAPYNAYQAEEQAVRDAKLANGVATFGIVAGSVLGLVTLGVATKYLVDKGKARRKERRAQEAEERNSLPARMRKRFQGYSDDFIEQAVEFGKLAELHHSKLASTDRSLHTSMEEVVGHLEQLVDLLADQGLEQSQRNRLAIEYTDRLKKMNRILGPDFYMAMALRPKEWPNVSERIRMVKSALASLDREILANIRRVNEDRELDFRVALHSFLDPSEMEVAPEPLDLLKGVDQDVDDALAAESKTRKKGLFSRRT